MKISAIQLRDFSGARRRKPLMNRLKSARLRHAEADRQLVGDLMDDALRRYRIHWNPRHAYRPMSVWNETSHHCDLPLIPATKLPRWRDLTETVKLFVGWDAGMEFEQAFAFTAHIDPDLLAKWEGEGAIQRNVEQRLRRAMRVNGIRDLPLGYVFESRSASGKSRSRIHLHGYVLCEDPLLATRFKVALEKALYPSLKRSRRTREIEVKRANREKVRFLRRGAWPFYIAKNAGSYDSRLPKRRVYISESLTDIARLAWTVRREE
ncbi:hypothetical protein [Sphingomonas sp. CFBP9021]|uniref:hypothetical protein n=1 Tax=Sphingomonas sp. CFBP9021 TaxID=3096534 RepID=UPI002A69DD7E|nr:hypothetical protein [Sphingomonas sp. CFBP9021]MDY0966406.1 hypothetical protein [Sphingomonas sp. CFBP9021]